MSFIFLSDRYVIICVTNMFWLYLCLGLFTFFNSFAYENIALKKPAYQQNRWTGITVDLSQASNAVDGLKSNLSEMGGECVISGDRKTATWWVNLTDILSIHHLRIYYRTENEPWGSTNRHTTDFLGFAVYISNTTDKSEGNLCFKDEDFNVTTIPSVINITCPMHGQYVIYYNERWSWTSCPEPSRCHYAYNDLCELEVYGCLFPGVYGVNCSIPCPDPNCRYCHIETGTCQGCKPGYQGHQCELECYDGKYGDVCGKECGNCADLSYCNNVNGTCLTGCEAGYQGELCLEECDDNYFGLNCKERCNETCIGCNRKTGVCENGCQRGWKGSYCHEECDNRLFGENCREQCGSCLHLEQCHHINGTCMDGCGRGYQGVYCTEECYYNYYGVNCKEMCNDRCNGCNRETGACENGCQPGWKGIYCHEVCENKLFGENCTTPCGHCRHLEQCHHINGTCMNGCDRGYKGVNCTDECGDNYFGVNCQESCNETCKGCNRKTGACENGCQAGWKGIFCHEVCDAGYYGNGCLQECSMFCKTSRDCHHVSGYCKHGCKSGWQGKDCLEVSSTDKQSFYIALCFICGSLLFNGFFVAYILMLRKSRRIESKKFTPALTTANTIATNNDRNGSEVDGEYQELVEIGQR